MTSESFNDLPGPGPSQIDRADDAADNVATTDDNATADDVATADQVATVPEEFPDPEAERLLEGAADDARATATEVMEEDVPLNDVMHDVYPEDVEREPLGVREFHTDLADPGQHDSIEERILQEEPEPEHDIVPRDAAKPDPEAPVGDPERPADQGEPTEPEELT